MQLQDRELMTCLQTTARGTETARSSRSSERLRAGWHKAKSLTQAGESPARHRDQPNGTDLERHRPPGRAGGCGQGRGELRGEHKEITTLDPSGTTLGL